MATAGPPLCIALTGATGFVGRHIVPRLVAAGHRVRALVRDPDRLPVQDQHVEPIRGDLLDDPSLARLVEGADAVIHLVGIIMEKGGGQIFDRIHREGTVRLLSAAGKAGVRRWVHMSALGSRPNAAAQYHRTKWAGEQAVRASGLDWTIFRPSVIHGPDGEFVEMVQKFWCGRVPPFVPYFSSKVGFADFKALLGAVLPRPGRGKAEPYVSNAPAGRLQPVWVEDVAACFVGALSLRRTIAEVYPVGGPDVYSWPQFFVACRRYVIGARPKAVVPIPVWKAKLATRMVPAEVLGFNGDQVIMSQEDSTCQINKVQTDFEIELAGFEATFAQYASQIHTFG